MHNRASAKQYSQRNTDCHEGYALIAVEFREHGPCACEPRCQAEADTEIDPKEIACKVVGHLLALNNRFCKPIQAEIQKEKAEGGNHGNHAKISGGEQSRQDDCRNQLDRKNHSLRGYGNASAAHGSAP
jgi:hypothetical protein